MGKIIFITGGCRSGKSTLALELGEKSKGDTAFVATAVAIDREMAGRIRNHRRERPRGWTTFEEPYALSRLLASLDKRFSTVIIDCVTVYLGNLMHKRRSAPEIAKEIDAAIEAARKRHGRCIFVSNEVGLGIVPATAMGREFRDIAGAANKSLAANAGTVYFMVSGIAQKIKG